ncbi:P2Y purinoceptor 1-like [Polyodon spathula]|uniref:P2Y purinoceptor 1-like n=1 Tax=Polyodon spathula TaxID=7913 RepID=UPI001B7EDB1A|nr:P2Y purinoceptor 1-like [Polyodon spathula]
MFLLSLAAVAVHGFYFSAADASIQNVKSSSTAAENKSRCNVVDKTFTSVFLPSVYVIVFFVGVISNCWGLRSLLAKWKTVGCINVFVLNLGIADLLYVITLPFLVSYYVMDEKWIFGHVFCKINRFCFNLNLYGSIGFLTCISVYRYLSIVHPMKVMGRIRVCHAIIISVITWVLVVAQLVPDLYFSKSNQNSSSCYDTTSNDEIYEYLPYSTRWTITGFCIPLLVILGCYGHVAFVLTNRKNPSVNSLMKQRCLKLIVTLTVLFVVCFIPYHVLRILNLKTRVLQIEGECSDAFNNIYVSYQVSRGLACLNSALNPLVYLVIDDKVIIKMHDVSKMARRSLVHLVARKSTQSSMDRLDFT